MKIPASFLEEVNQHYTKANLETLYRAFLQDFLKKNKELAERQGVSTAVLEKKKLSKNDLAEIFAVVLFNKEFFETFRNALPAPLPQVWEKLLLEGPAMQYSLEKEYGVKIAEKKSSYGYEIAIDPLYLCFPHKAEVNYYAYGNEPKVKVLFSLPPDLKRHLISHIELPEEYRLKSVPVPVGAPFLYADDSGILEELTLFLAYYQQGDLKYTNSGKPQASSINKMRKFCNSREFFPEDKAHKELVSLRTQLIAEALPLAGKVKELTADVPDLLKRIIKNFTQGELSVLYSLLFHLKGSGYVKKNYELSSVNRELVDILKDLPAGKWFDVENLQRHVSIFYPPLMPVSYYTAQNYLYLEVKVSDKYGTYKDRYAPGPGFYPQMITAPMLKSVMFFFAALGLADIAYGYPKNKTAEQIGLEYMSVWDGLRYVRLNDLGAYVLGQTSEFRPPKREVSGALYLEETMLLINYTGEDKVTMMMLDKIANKSTGTRYKVDYATFLKDCSTKKDIQSKIDLFRTHIEEKPPQIWEEFFLELLAKYNPLAKESSYRVFVIPADNRELISLIARDEVLKKLVIKAEQFHILVDEKEMSQFRSRLEKYGYLMEKGKSK